MTLSDSGKLSTRAIVIQLAILVAVAGVFAFVKIYAPRMEKAREARQLADRESRVEDFFNTMVAEDSGRTVETQGGQAHPQSLRSTPSVQEVQQELGGPDTSTTDFAGDLHLTWIGTSHTLQASFNRGQLYCLTLKDIGTGHGVNVFESSARWQAF